MTTSSYSNRAQLGRTLALLAAPVLFACSSEPGVDPCPDEQAPTTDTIPDTAVRVSRLRLESRASYDEQGKRSESTVVTLALADLSLVLVESRPPSPCCGSLSCFLLTGNPVRKCRNETTGPCGTTTCDQGSETCVNDACVPCTDQPLDAKSATVDGLATGTVALEPAQSAGSWLKAGIAAPLFKEGQVRAQLDGGDTTGFFPSYSQVIDAPAPLVLTAPDPTNPQSPGNGDLPIKWDPGNGSWIEAQLKSTASGVHDTIVCVAKDDGCMTIPAGALDTIRLDMQPDDRIKLSVQRVVSQTTPLANEETVAQVKGLTRIDMVLPQ